MKRIYIASSNLADPEYFQRIIDYVNNHFEDSMAIIHDRSKPFDANLPQTCDHMIVLAPGKEHILSEPFWVGRGVYSILEGFVNINQDELLDGTTKISHLNYYPKEKIPAILYDWNNDIPVTAPFVGVETIRKDDWKVHYALLRGALYPIDIHEHFQIPHKP